MTIKAILRESGKNTSITVPVQDRMVTLSLDQTEIAVGGIVTATATVSGAGVEEITGKIRFYLDGAPVGSILTLEEGKAILYNSSETAVWWKASGKCGVYQRRCEVRRQ